MSVWNCRHGRQVCHCAICAPEAEERMRARDPMPDAPGDEMLPPDFDLNVLHDTPATDTPAETRVSDAENLRRAIKALTDCTHPGTGASLAAIYGVDLTRLAALSVPVQGEP